MLNSRASSCLAQAQAIYANAERTMAGFGVAIAWLELTIGYCNQATRVGRNGPSAIQPMMESINLIQRTANRELVRVQQDNNTVYHESVPSSSTLPQIAQAMIAKPQPIEDMAAILEVFGIREVEQKSDSSSRTIDLFRDVIPYQVFFMHCFSICLGNYFGMLQYLLLTKRNFLLNATSNIGTRNCNESCKRSSRPG